MINLLIADSFWNKKTLTYKIANVPSKLNEDNVEREIKEAFNQWTRHTNLNFRKVTNGDVCLFII